MPRVITKDGEVKFSIVPTLSHETVPSGVGSMILQHHGFKYNPETMQLDVVETDKEDRQAYIDSFADECGVYNILKKYSLTGDASLLNQRELQYGDISDLPVDELNPAHWQGLADQTLAALNAKLGTNMTAEEFAALSQDELVAMIVRASTPQQEEASQSEGGAE